MEESVRKNEVFEKKTAREEMSQPGGLTFDIPAISVPIPSQGLVYPPNSSLHNKQEVEIKAMTAAQENILTNGQLAKKGTLMSHLLNSCLVDKTIDVREMLVGDRSTLMIALRVSGYGMNYPTKVECPNCGNTEEKTFDLRLPLKNLELEPVEPNSNLFETVLPMSKYTVRFKFLSGRDEEEMTISSMRKKKIQGDAGSEIVTTGLLSMIESINGISDKVQLARAIPKMPALDSQHLLKFIRDNEPGIDMTKEILCSECDYEGEVEMPLGASFFWPNAK